MKTSLRVLAAAAAVTMKTRIQKWGNSLALPIAEPELSLEQLVAQITPRNRHSETETGHAVGNEAW